MGYEEYNEQVKGWMKAVWNSRGICMDQTLFYCKQMEQYATEQNDDKLLGFSYYYAGEAFYMLNDIERLFRYMTKALASLEKTGQWELVARAYNLLGITSANRGNIPFAMDYYLNGLTYCKQFHLLEAGAMIYINIGNLYLEVKEYTQAKDSFEEALLILKSEPQRDGYYSCLTAIYIGLSRCGMERNLSSQVEIYTDKLQTECKDNFDAEDMLYYQMYMASYYNYMGLYEKQEQCMASISGKMLDNFPVMDYFDELYRYSTMLLNNEKYDEFAALIQNMEHSIEKTKVANLQRKLVNLKIEYSRKTKEKEVYKDLTVKYYELSMSMEKENQYMVSSLLEFRKILDYESKMRREAERQNLALQEKSETDALTKISNRLRLNTFIEEAFECAKKESHSFGVEILDIDYFKQYNDNYGHQAGDKCLVKIAKQLKKLEKHGNVNVFRYGGDEFVIVYEGYQKSAIESMMKELKESVASKKLEHKYSLADQIVTVSQGAYVEVPRKEEKVYDFLHAADVMLYKVKQKSKNDYLIGQRKDFS